MKSKVIIKKCSNYSQQEVDKAIEETIAEFGGLEKFILPKQRVLIKPNILMERPPEDCVTTHPSIIRSVIKQVKKAGAIPLVGDSPGAAIQGTKKILEVTKIEEACREEGAEIVNFETEGIEKVKTEFDFLPYYYLSEIFKKVDVVINLPKLKTHGLTKYTGAIKNMFGAVPGMCKPDVHCQAPNIKNFSQAIVNIFARVRPSLNIMDAVYGMEGNGPSGGNPKKIGYIITSADAVALDSICSYIIGYTPKEIYTTLFAAEQKLGEINFNNIDFGEIDLASLQIKNFAKPPFGPEIIRSFLPPQILQYIYSQIKIKPHVNIDKCKKCLICIKHCPVSAIKHVKNKFIFNYDTCIECFCCHELCKYKAIELKRNYLARLILRDR